jgi:hypothetical protein
MTSFHRLKRFTPIHIGSHSLTKAHIHSQIGFYIIIYSFLVAHNMRRNGGIKYESLIGRKLPLWDDGWRGAFKGSS